jgi:hypothetical protein
MFVAQISGFEELKQGCSEFRLILMPIAHRELSKVNLDIHSLRVSRSLILCVLRDLHVFEIV